ncbi:hypothetical protein WJX72_003550 [[Myrmecia] bisecta]|uniref:Uncharacterized protein n=1 Tax=[Myrmecia] bisecta TaxID=41462 RepID=A0AAW1PGS8_9CHLO
MDRRPGSGNWGQGEQSGRGRSSQGRSSGGRDGSQHRSQQGPQRDQPPSLGRDPEGTEAGDSGGSGKKGRAKKKSKGSSGRLQSEGEGTGSDHTGPSPSPPPQADSRFGQGGRGTARFGMQRQQPQQDVGPSTPRQQPRTPERKMQRTAVLRQAAVVRTPFLH